MVDMTAYFRRTTLVNNQIIFPENNTMKIEELKIAAEKSNVIFKRLKMKYPNLDGYLVFSSRDGQCGLTINLVDISKSFPQMVVDCNYKMKGLQLWQKINDIEAKNKQNVTQKSTEKLREQLEEIVKNLEVKEDTFVEIRFKSADLDLIFELQKDELISQKHTPQTKASIRIVLGTLGELL